VRLRYSLLERGHDLVFVVRSKAARASGAEVDEAVGLLLTQSGLLRVKAQCAG